MRKGYDGLGFYRDPEDPRLFVPKRIPTMGWTINLAHRHGRAALIGLTLFVAGAAI